MAINPKMLSKVPMPAMTGEDEASAADVSEDQAEMEEAPIDLSVISDDELMMEVEKRGLNINRA